MPSILSDADKETVKRTIPKASNKILAVAVARLYVAYPTRNRWTWTGLQGAAVLCNDLVGNAFFLKMVDISAAHRGVIWDQEIYDTFQYNQDRTFFHSFELEHPDCMAGLSFADEKEARKFKQKMDEREKSASKATKAQLFGSNAAGGALYARNGQNGQNGQNGGVHKSHGKVGAFLRSHRRSSSPPPPQPQGASASTPQAGLPVYGSANASRNQSVAATIDLADPTWQPILKELMEMGISEDAIMQNADFIKDYIKQKQQEELKNGLDSAVQHPRFRAPPPLADAGKFAVKEGPALHPSGKEPGRARAASGATPGPPPPPRPAKTPLDDDAPHTVFRVPPPFTGDRKSSAPAAPSSRGPVPPPPPSREPIPGPPPSLPPKVPDRGAVPPPPPARSTPPAAPPPPPLPPLSSAAPPPPPLPSLSNSAPPPPPPPPMPSTSGPPPPPPPPPPASGPAVSPLPAASGDHSDLLASIRASGGKGGGGLRKVNQSQIRDRSAAAVPGADHSSGPPPGAGGPGGADPGGMAGALAAALSQRKKKVSGSDDEKDNDDDW
ncbi:hypothetical protein DV737_g64, partial [Chaetothyriales sp. CBS 132003]